MCPHAHTNTDAGARGFSRGAASHTPIYVSSYSYICVLIPLYTIIPMRQLKRSVEELLHIPLYMCLNAPIYESSCPDMCPHTSTYMSSYADMCPRTPRSVGIPLYMCPHTRTNTNSAARGFSRGAASQTPICVLIPLYVSSYPYICVLLPLYHTEAAAGAFSRGATAAERRQRSNCVAPRASPRRAPYRHM